MFAIYATDAAPDDPLSTLEIGEQPEPVAREGWVRVKISHASLNRHDLFTRRGITAHPELGPNGYTDYPTLKVVADGMPSTHNLKSNMITPKTTPEHPAPSGT